MNRRKIFPLMLGSLVWLSACDDDSDIVPQAQVGVSFNTVTAAAPVNGRLASTNSLSFTSGTIILSKVRFQGESGADSLEVEFELEQEVQVDFATGATSPDISTVAFRPGTYEEIEVELELRDGNSVPAIVLNGTFTDAGGQAHPVRFEFNSSETFEVEREGTITFAEGQSAVAQVTFNPAAWFAGVSAEELSAATKNGEGVIIISSTQNTDIFDTVADGLDLATDVEIEN